MAGIPDGLSEVAARHGLVPYSDAVEEIDASELPGVATAFGVTRFTGERPCLLRLPWTLCPD